MTQQIHDRLRYRGEEWLVQGASGEGLFVPHRHRVKVKAISTACWRGFHCGYEVSDGGELVLREVYLGLADKLAATGARLFGRMTGTYPRQGRQWTPEGLVDIAWRSHDHRLTDLCEPMPLTGTLLIGHGWLQDVRELTFRGGRLVGDLDGAAAVDQLCKRPIAPDLAPVAPADLAAWQQRLELHGHRLGTSPNFMRELNEQVRARETCAVEIVAGPGLEHGLDPFKVYVDGYIHGNKLPSQGTQQQVVRLEPGGHRIVLRGRDVHDPQRIESNTVNFETGDGARLRIDVDFADGRLALSAPTPA